jgi:hypothetical protein
LSASGGDGGHARSNSGADSSAGLIEIFSLDAPETVALAVDVHDVVTPVSQSQGVTERPD